jgi:uncharacterized DUF497 family protein
MPPGFEWDVAKNAANVAKHGIDFDDAVRIFEGPVRSWNRSTTGATTARSELP